MIRNYTINDMYEHTNYLWSYLGLTGFKEKYEAIWLLKQYGYIPQDLKLMFGCPFCSFYRLSNCKSPKTKEQFYKGCTSCPFVEHFGGCEENDSPYRKWTRARTTLGRKKYALEVRDFAVELAVKHQRNHLHDLDVNCIV